MNEELEKKLIQYVQRLNARIQLLETDSSEHKKKIKSLESDLREANRNSIRLQQFLKAILQKINYLKERVAAIEFSTKYKK